MPDTAQDNRHYFDSDNVQTIAAYIGNQYTEDDPVTDETDVKQTWSHLCKALRWMFPGSRRTTARCLHRIFAKCPAYTSTFKTRMGELTGKEMIDGCINAEYRRSNRKGNWVPAAKWVWYISALDKRGEWRTLVEDADGKPRIRSRHGNFTGKPRVKAKAEPRSNTSSHWQQRCKSVK